MDRETRQHPASTAAGWQSLSLLRLILGQGQQKGEGPKLETKCLTEGRRELYSADSKHHVPMPSALRDRLLS